MSRTIISEESSFNNSEITHNNNKKSTDEKVKDQWVVI